MLLDAKILLKAPIGSVVQQVTPKPDSVDGLSILLTVKRIAPGEEQIVEVSINYPRDEFAKFESMVISENWGHPAWTDRSAANATPEMTASMLQPRSSGMLQPGSSGLMKPKVPAMTVSATTNRVLTDQHEVDTEATGLIPMVTSHKISPANGLSDEHARTEAGLRTEPGTDQSVIKSYMYGPAEVIVGEEVEFSIDVQNLSANAAEGLIVQLSIPQDMKVTILDRAAWYDNDSRKVTWKVDSIEGRSLETIRYKAVVKTASSVEQSIVIGMGSSVQSTSKLKTTSK